MRLTRLELNILIDALYGSLRIADAKCLLYQYPEETRQELWTILQQRLNREWLETEDGPDELESEIEGEKQKETQ